MAAIEALEDPRFMPGDEVYTDTHVKEFATWFNISGTDSNGGSRRKVAFVGIGEEGKEVVQLEGTAKLIDADELYHIDEMPDAVLDYQLGLIKKLRAFKY